MIQKNVANFFRRVVKEAINIRKEKGIVRPDMIHLLLQAQRGLLKHDDKDSEDPSFAVVKESEFGTAHQKRKTEITDEDITAQAVVFFLAGFHSASTLMSFICYELAVNPDIQKRLIDEIDTTMEKCSGDITYEALMGMKYLDMVVSGICLDFNYYYIVKLHYDSMFLQKPCVNGHLPKLLTDIALEIT